MSTLQTRWNFVQNPFSMVLIVVTIIWCLVASAFQLVDLEFASYLGWKYSERWDLSHQFFYDLVQLWSGELTWIAVFCLMLWIAYSYAPLPGPAQLDHFLLRRRRPALLIAGVSFGLLVLVIAYAILEAFPNSSDEYVYLFQAELLSQGKLHDKAHSLQEFFSFNHIVHKDGKMVGRFPPGWPLILSLAYVAQLPPAIVNPVLGTLTLWVFYLYCRRAYGHTVALWAGLTLAVSAFFIFNSASFFSHTACLLMIVTFVHFYYKYKHKHQWRFLVIAGFCIGISMTIRYLTGIIAFLPFVVYTMYRYRLESIRVFLLIGLGALPVFLLMFWYNAAITGEPLLPVTQWAYDNEGLGFVNDHSVVKGVEHLIRRTGLFVYWSSVGLLVLAVVAVGMVFKTKSWGKTRPEDYIFCLLIVGYFFYYHIGGNQYGPRFLLEGFPFLIAFVVNRVVASRSTLLYSIMYSSIALQLVKLPFIAAREATVIDQRQDVYDVVEAERLNNALVFITNSTCAIRPMPAEDLTRNHQDFGASVLYVVDRGHRNAIVMDHFPERNVYWYTRHPEASGGRVSLVRRGRNR